MESSHLSRILDLLLFDLYFHQNFPPNLFPIRYFQYNHHLLNLLNHFHHLQIIPSPYQQIHLVDLMFQILFSNIVVKYPLYETSLHQHTHRNLDQLQHNLHHVLFCRRTSRIQVLKDSFHNQRNEHNLFLYMC